MDEPTPKSPPFADNWAYVKTELQWLDRLLLLAVGRQRKERRETDKVSRADRDRLTRHWWKGIVNLDTPPSYDDGRPPLLPDSLGSSGSNVQPTASPATERSMNSNNNDSNNSGQPDPHLNKIDPRHLDSKHTPTGYQKQLDGRIRASRAEGILLGLPTLCDRLQLTLFEKNLLILGLAPEVNRRYARLYAYLQESETSPLPQVDLALKLLCRNDQEWYTARRRLAEESPLLQMGLVSLVAPEVQPLLTHRVRLSPPLVNYLLANPVDAGALDGLLAAVPADAAPLAGKLPNPEPLRAEPLLVLPAVSAADAWKPLVLPRSLKRELKHLCQRLQLLAFDPPAALAEPRGTWAILVGPAGTGKAMAAQTIAQAAQTAILRVDLKHHESHQRARYLQIWQDQSPTVLLIESAELFLGPQAEISAVQFEQFLCQRQQQPCLTLFTVTLQAKVAPRWLQACDRLLHFPLPDAATRARLWKQAFPKGVTLDPRISWVKLAEQGKLTAAQIQAIARDAALYAQIEANQLEANQQNSAPPRAKPRVTPSQIQRAWQQRQNGRH
ncbi:MAG: AAA family ATPase [Synechococcales cyanobacterium CRU_2_2]|nr:AAA family ATPase [Synechococcales cyanobacterium CRU_2_2]